MNSFYNNSELSNLGFRSLGKNTLISKKVSFYGIENMNIGDNVRIDDFCILSGHITLGSNIHISAYCALYGSNGIEMEDFTGLSPRCTIFSATDDFSGNYLIGPMVDKHLTNITGGKVLIRKYSQIGAGCILFPAITIEEGVAVGAMSLVNKTLSEWSIFCGIPAKKIKGRNKQLRDLIR
jgi:acetyltransferase-like isoleucine patch superfamily enzyme